MASNVRAAHSWLENEREDFLEGLPEIGTHESIDHGVDKGVGVGHAVGPDLDFIGIIVALDTWDKGLEENKELHGAPADGEENHNDGHHAGDLDPCGFRALCNLLPLELRSNEGTVAHTPTIPG